MVIQARLSLWRHLEGLRPKRARDSRVTWVQGETCTRVQCPLVPHRVSEALPALERSKGFC